MSIVQRNTYVVGSNNDLTNALLNIDLNRIGGDLTYLVNDSGTLKVAVGSLIEAEGSIYAVTGSAETPTGTPTAGRFLMFDPSVPEFSWQVSTGTYDPARGGVYDGSDRRQCRFRLTGATTFDVLLNPTNGTTQFLGNVIIQGRVNTGPGMTEVHLMNQNVRTTDLPTFAGVLANGRFTSAEHAASLANGATVQFLATGPAAHAMLVLVGANEWGTAVYFASAAGGAVSNALATIATNGGAFATTDAGTAVRLYWSSNVLTLRNSTGAARVINVGIFRTTSFLALP